MRQANRLTPLAVKNAKKTMCDGYGLWLQVSPKFGTKAWLLRYMLDGKADSMGLGPVDITPLAMARARAQKARELLHEGINPRLARNAERAERKLEAARAVSFKQAAEAYVESHRSGWRNKRHGAQWTTTLGMYVYPVIGDLPVAAVDVALVLKILRPIWNERNETARRIRGRVESVLDYAKASGYRTGENPAAWRGNLDQLLPAPSKVQRVEHHAAMAYRDVPAFMAKLRAQDGAMARCLEFAILCASRAGEVVGARWNEIDFDQKVWVVPAGRMKGHKEHRIPLGDRALEILNALPRNGEELVFPGAAVNLVLAALRKIEATATVHGFRSSFRDWAAEATTYPAEIAEMALAHSVGSAVERAYRRTDLMERRRRLMSDWAAYCERAPAESGEVIPIRKGA
jgi:integrase